MIFDKDGCPQLERRDRHTIVIADEANAALRAWWESQPFVYGEPNEFSSDPRHHSWSTVYPNNPIWTHRARLCGIMPIKAESAEDLVKDLVRIWDETPECQSIKLDLHNWIERARKILGEK